MPPRGRHFLCAQLQQRLGCRIAAESRRLRGQAWRASIRRCIGTRPLCQVRPTSHPANGSHVTASSASNSSPRAILSPASRMRYLSCWSARDCRAVASTARGREAARSFGRCRRLYAARGGCRSFGLPREGGGGRMHRCGRCGPRPGFGWWPATGTCRGQQDAGAPSCRKATCSSRPRPVR